MRSLLVVSLLLSGCAAGTMPCRVGADCESGVCRIDGECLPLDEDGGAVDAGAMPGDGGLEDAGPDAGAPSDDAGSSADAATDAGVADDAGSARCNGDGVLTRDELALPIGETIPLRVAFDATVDTRGAARPDGSRIWDYEGPYGGDVDRSFARRALEGQWFEASFAGATYSVPLSAEQDLEGVFEETAGALLLRGIVSSSGGSGRTELSYDPPLPVWTYPLEVGATWSATSSVSGVASGVGAFYSERWSFAVDAAGEVTTPAGVRSVVRVNAQLTRTVGALVTVSRRHSYVEECVGTVASVFGADGDSAAEPTMAAEIWRLR